jgi:hypothetical protein
MPPHRLSTMLFDLVICVFGRFELERAVLHIEVLGQT